MRRSIVTPEAPQAIGPYNQAILVDGWLFASGQIALDPATMQMVGEDVTGQARQVFRNLAAVLRAAGGGFEHVVKTTVFLKDMVDFAAMNAVYASIFDGIEPPARATVAAAGLPKGALVEIELVARIGP